VAAEPLNMCGATSGGVQRLDAPPPQRLVYLSCGLPALLRDLEELVDKGPWRVVYAHAFLFFPGTDSVETLVVMDREA
jgi:tRNA/tmRNA/rRNA uracil-C5-methylase (TrmA/RlmC/RlmD family)